MTKRKYYRPNIIICVPGDLAKMAQLDIPDCTYNWLVDFFNGHSHHTKYDEQTSTLKIISASIIQGSAMRPASYVVDASDMQALPIEMHFVSMLTTHIS